MIIILLAFLFSFTKPHHHHHLATGAKTVQNLSPPPPPPPPRPTNKLQLNNALKPFGNCTVQLVVFSLKRFWESYDGWGYLSGLRPGEEITYPLDPDLNYEVEPVHFPVLLTAPYYNLTRFPNITSPLAQEEEDVRNQIYCRSSSSPDEYFQMHSLEEQAMGHSRWPPPRQTCFAQVLVPPKFCDKAWRILVETTPSLLDPRPIPHWLFYYSYEHLQDSCRTGGFTITTPQVDKFVIQVVQNSEMFDSFAAPKALFTDSDKINVFLDWEFIVSIGHMWMNQPMVSESGATGFYDSLNRLYSATTKLLFILGESSAAEERGGGWISVVDKTLVLPYFEAEGNFNNGWLYCWKRMNYRKSSFFHGLDHYCSLPAFQLFEYDAKNIALAQLEEFHFKCRGGIVWRALGIYKDINFKHAPYLRHHQMPNFKSEHVWLAALFPNSTFLPAGNGNNDFDKHFKMYIEMPTILFKYGLLSEAYITVQNSRDSIHFISCAEEVGKRDSLKFGFFAAYDWPTWTALILLGAISGGIAQMYVLKSSKCQPSWGDTFGHLTMIMSLLLTQGISTVHKCRLLCGLWILVMILLKELYEGRTIQELTVPLPNSRLETFKDALDNNIIFHSDKIGRMETDFIEDLEGSIIQWSAYRDNFKSSTPSMIDSAVTVFDAYLRVDNYGRFSKDVTAKLIQQVYRPSDLQELDQMSTVEYYVNVIAKRDRDSYVSVHHRVMDMYHMLQEKGIGESDIMISKEHFGSSYLNLEFRNIPLPTRVFMRRFRALFHSGIVELWDNWLVRVSTWNDTVHSARLEFPPQKLSLRDNVVVVFYMLLALLLASTVVFLFEIRKGLSFGCGALLVFLDNGGEADITIRGKNTPVHDFTN